MTSAVSSNSAPRPKVDPVSTVAKWLATLVDSSAGCIEPHCLDVIPRDGAKPQTWCGFYSPDKLVDMARDALQITPIAKGVYFTLNLLKPVLQARRTGRCEFAGRDVTSTDADVLWRRWLLIDIDPTTEVAGVSATADEKKSAEIVAVKVRDYLIECGWPALIVADSGNGWHLFRRVDLPNDASSTELVKRCLHALAAKFDTNEAKVDRSVFNAGRIVKLPGTMARKGNSTTDRPHRRAQLKIIPEAVEVMPVERLKALAAEAPQASRPAAAAGRSATRSRGGATVTDRARAYLAKLSPGIQGAKGNGPTFRAAAALVQDFALSESDAWPLLCEFNRRCEPPWDEGESARSEDSLRNVLKGAIEAPGERGRLLVDNRTNDHAATPGHTTTFEPLADEDDSLAGLNFSGDEQQAPAAITKCRIELGTDEHRVNDQAVAALSLDPEPYFYCDGSVTELSAK